MKKFIIASLFMIFLTGIVKVDAQTVSKDAIKWYNFEEGMKLAKKQDKEVIIDFYTDWCGWCTKMDKETFRDSAVVAIINKYFIAIKFNAESADPVEFNGETFTNPHPGSRSSAHQLAVKLMQGQLSYPTYVYLNEKGETITITKGYMIARDLAPLLKYIGTDAYKTKTWKEFIDGEK